MRGQPRVAGLVLEMGVWKRFRCVGRVFERFGRHSVAVREVEEGKFASSADSAFVSPMVGSEKQNYGCCGIGLG